MYFGDNTLELLNRCFKVESSAIFDDMVACKCKEHNLRRVSDGCSLKGAMQPSVLRRGADQVTLLLNTD
jgi:hypothetical protein